MGFDVAGDAYDSFMGRYSRELAPQLAEYAGISAGMRVLDVGCGPGALTSRLVEIVSADLVSAAEPSESFVAVARERLPGVDVRRAVAAELPWDSASFDAVLAQLVLNFVPDPLAAVAEMSRVTGPGGVVAACTWDYREGMRMIRMFWDAARSADPEAPTEVGMPCTTTAALAAVWEQAGLAEVVTSSLEVEVAYLGFEDLWGSFGQGVGPAGTYLAALDPPRRAALREALFTRLGSPTGLFTLPARAWVVRGRRDAADVSEAGATEFVAEAHRQPAVNRDGDAEPR